MTDDIEYYGGLDWGSQNHRAYLIDRAGKVIGEHDVSHTGAGLGELCDWLLAKSGCEPARVAVAIETTHGPVVETLLERGFAVFAISPKQLDRFRDRFTVAGAKDDSRDARVLADSLRTDARAFRPLAISDPLIIELREWSRMVEDLQQERTRLANRVREQLWRYYPQMLRLGDDLASDWFLALWQLVPTPAKAVRAREGAIRRLLEAHRIRRFDAAEALRILRDKPLTVAPGTTEAARAHLRALAERIGLVNKQLRKARHQLDQLCAELEASAEDPSGHNCEQRDVAILRSLPGVGRIILATLLAEGSEPLGRRDYHVLRTLSGVAPVTRRSGKTCLVIRRLACNERLRNALYHWARVASYRDPTSKERYAALRQRGHSHGRALRTVGDRLLKVACTLLDRQLLFDPNHKSLLAAVAE